MWWIIPLVLFVVSVALLLFLGLRHMRTLRLLNIDALPETKSRKVKEAIILERFDRIAGIRFRHLQSSVGEMASAVSGAARRLVQRLYALEQQYNKKQSHSGGAQEEVIIRRLFEEASQALREGNSFEAEKRYIDIIRRKPKEVKAYEALGNLYLEEKKYSQAKETLEFALKLKPDDASVHVSLGELALREHKMSEALAQFTQAIGKRPHNPRYLDFFIESALACKNGEEAARGIGLLRDVNPENNKLADFEGRLAVLETGLEPK